MDPWLDAVVRNMDTGALAVTVVLAIARGWLVPGRTVDRLGQAAKDITDIQEKRLAESVAREQEWREAWRVSEKVNGELARQMDEILTVIRAVPQAVQRGDRP